MSCYKLYHLLNNQDFCAAHVMSYWNKERKVQLVLKQRFLILSKIGPTLGNSNRIFDHKTQSSDWPLGYVGLKLIWFILTMIFNTQIKLKTQQKHDFKGLSNKEEINQWYEWCTRKQYISPISLKKIFCSLKHLHLTEEHTLQHCFWKTRSKKLIEFHTIWIKLLNS